MSNGEVFYSNLIDPDFVTVSSEATGFEKKFLSDNNQGNVWRSTVITSTTITIDMGAVTAIEGIVGLNTNMVIGDTTYKFEASTDNFSSTSESEDVTFDGVNIFFKGSWNYRYYRFRLVKASGSYIQMGMIYLAGLDYILDRNYNTLYDDIDIEKWNTKTTDGGQKIRTLQYTLKQFNYEFSVITEAQKNKLLAISKNKFIVWFPFGLTGVSYYGYIDANSFIVHNNGGHDGNMSFEESPK